MLLLYDIIAHHIIVLSYNGIVILFDDIILHDIPFLIYHHTEYHGIIILLHDTITHYTIK